jgi:nucleoside-diphosphate-sugar epimerase
VKVVLAGASGAIGLPLTHELIQAGHQVVAVTRSQQSHSRLRALGAQPIAVDVLDAEQVLARLGSIEADAVISELTDLRKPPATHRSMRGTNRLRIAGTANLVRLAERIGARRFVTQSMLFGYGYGDAGGKVYTEDDPFGPPGIGRFEDHLAAMRANEKAVLTSSAFEGVALRYGLFYGVGAGDDIMVTMLRKRRLPVLKHAGPLSWIYLDDAVGATVRALEAAPPGTAYNVVDDEPVSWTRLMTELAAAIGAPPPRTVPSWLVAATPLVRTLMRGGMIASNDRARTELEWRPTVPSYRQGVGRIARQHAGGPRLRSAAIPSEQPGR